MFIFISRFLQFKRNIINNTNIWAFYKQTFTIILEQTEVRIISHDIHCVLYYTVRKINNLSSVLFILARELISKMFRSAFKKRRVIKVVKFYLPRSRVLFKIISVPDRMKYFSQNFILFLNSFCFGLS